MPHEQGLTADEQDLRSVVEAAFGPGAFDLLATNDEPGENVGLGDVPSDNELPRQGADINGKVSGEKAADRDPSFDAADQSAETTVILFELAGSFYSVPIGCVTEIQREIPTTAIPHVPSWVLGVTNLRGSIISVVDVGLRLGLTAVTPASPRHMIVVRISVNDALIGLLVDHVIGIRTLAGWLPDLHGHPNSEGHSEDAAAGFVHEWREFDTQSVAILDVEKLVSLE